MDYKRLGKRIREERLRLKLTQAQLAEDIEISDTYMGAIERGERSLTLDTLVRLVNRLGVTVDYLLSDSVSDSDSNIMEQFKQIVDCQPLERKQMAINVLRTIFSYFDNGGV
jgi:transcriptional regulator with XRE-family HTH domain